MKKLINSPDTVVTDALAGMAAAHPALSVDIENKVVTQAGDRPRARWASCRVVVPATSRWPLAARGSR